jgi:hypothetical protein
MIGRRRELENCKNRMNRLLKNLPNIYQSKDEPEKFNEVILIRGTLGSGKSLFIRKFMYEFIDYKDYRLMKYQFSKKSEKIPFVFVSFQSPVTNFDPMNGWRSIVKQIYHLILKELKPQKQIENLKLGTENLKVNCDIIGKILFKSFSYPAVKFIEEILEVNFN